jgi:pseudouridylate synthase
MLLHEEVAQALADGTPIVALESTIISHGLPQPQNLEVARQIEDRVRAGGAVPATIAVVAGQVRIGLNDAALEAIATRPDVVKASSRDLAVITAGGGYAATTVAATAHLASLVGIPLFATGGLGGVHRGALESWDESADLIALARLPITVVCAGVKSILDIPATLERLETLGVGLVGYQTNQFPGFYLTDSGFTIEHRVDTPEAVAAIIRARAEIGTDRSALVVAHALPVADQIDPALHDSLLTGGMAAAQAAGITGKGATPFLLEYFHRISEGETLRANIDIILNNALLAAQIASALGKVS